MAGIKWDNYKREKLIKHLTCWFYVLFIHNIFIAILSLQFVSFSTTDRCRRIIINRRGRFLHSKSQSELKRMETRRLCEICFLRFGRFRWNVHKVEYNYRGYLWKTIALARSTTSDIALALSLVSSESCDDYLARILKLLFREECTLCVLSRREIEKSQISIEQRDCLVETNYVVHYSSCNCASSAIWENEERKELTPT